MSCLIMGVHLDEPASSAIERRWPPGHVSSHVSAPVKPHHKWTEEDLDAFVRQLSNPQHQVTKLNQAGETSSPVRPTNRQLHYSKQVDQGTLESPRKDSFDLCHDLKNIDKARAPLARSETDSHVALSAEDPTKSSSSFSRSGEDVSAESSRSSLISGLSGLRLIKNKKLARSSHANAKRSALSTSREKSQDSNEKSSSDCLSGSVDATAHGEATSPECSDGESGAFASASAISDQASMTKDVGSSAAIISKKRRFRKMLTRPLNRSQSAGCAKDVPAAHSMFTKKPQKKSKEAESTRKGRASEGDIRRVRLHSDDIEDEEETSLSCGASVSTELSVSSSGASRLLGRIHKTKSADATMLASEEFGAIGATTAQPCKQHKSRNIAKKISRKMQFLRRRHTDSTLGIDERDEGARRLATIEPEEAKQWSKSFNTLLFDKTGLELFRGFLLSEHSDENIEFWIACENYKSNKNTKQLPEHAMRIYNEYVAVRANREVNLDAETRLMTYESVTSNPTRQTFDEAQRRVQALMEKDSYRRFLESEIYVDLVAGNLQIKS